MTLITSDREQETERDIEMREEVNVKFCCRLCRFVHNYLTSNNIIEPRERKHEAYCISERMIESNDFQSLYWQWKEQMISDFKNTTSIITLDDCDQYFEWDFVHNYLENMIVDYLQEDGVYYDNRA